MSLRTKLTVAFLTIVVALWAVCVVTISVNGKVDKEFQALKSDIVPGGIAMVEMDRAVTEAIDGLTQYSVHGDEEIKSRTQSVMRQLVQCGRKHLEHETHIGQEERAAAEDLIAKINRLNSEIVESLNLRTQGAGVDALAKRESEVVRPAARALRKQLREHKAVHMEELAEAQVAIEKAHVYGTRVLVLLTVTITLIAISIALLTTRSITKPLQALLHGTERVGEGDLECNVGTSSNDEIGALSKAFDRMTDRLRETLVSRTELQESDEYVRSILTTIQTGIVVIDAEKHVIVYANPAALAMIDVSKEEIVGRVCHEYICQAEVGRCPITDLSQEVDNSERILLKPDGQTVPILKTVTSVVLNGRKHLVESFVDISERKRSEERLRETLKELERFNRLMTGREERVLELKREINDLMEELGRTSKYTTTA